MPSSVCPQGHRFRTLWSLVLSSRPVDWTEVVEGSHYNHGGAASLQLCLIARHETQSCLVLV